MCYSDLGCPNVISREMIHGWTPDKPHGLSQRRRSFPFPLRVPPGVGGVAGGTGVPFGSIMALKKTTQKFQNPKLSTVVD